MTSRSTIKYWLKQGVDLDATHVMIVCDTLLRENYPIFVQPEDNIENIIKKYNGRKMQKVMEVYNLKMSIYMQLNLDEKIWNL